MTGEADIVRNRQRELLFNVEWAGSAQVLIQDLSAMSAEMRKSFLALTLPRGLAVPKTIEWNIGPAAVALDFGGRAFDELANQVECLAEVLMSSEIGSDDLRWIRVDRTGLPDRVQNPNSIIAVFPFKVLSEKTLQDELKRYENYAHNLQKKILTVFRDDNVPFFEANLEDRITAFNRTLAEVRDLFELAGKKLFEQ
ncbi:hypothetical protein [Tsukamurella pulmonis]|uniref:hypothetical protein n=1 Tax=Tsukamurella pulmonis TaxID=47312 RepID=UPI0011120A83|nr:hypothetical protein [Tsukamurella pulmonis]